MLQAYKQTIGLFIFAVRVLSVVNYRNPIQPASRQKRYHLLKRLAVDEAWLRLGLKQCHLFNPALPPSVSATSPRGWLASFSGGRTLIEVSRRQQPEREPGGEVRQVVLRTTSVLAHWLQLSLRPIPEPIHHMTREMAFADWLRAVSLTYAWGWGQPAQTRSIE